MGLFTIVIQQCQRNIDNSLRETQAKEHKEETDAAAKAHTLELEQQRQATREAQAVATRSAIASEASAKAAQYSISLAAKGLSTSQATLEFSERAWINLVSVAKSQNRRAFVFTFENQGRTAAYQVDTVSAQHFKGSIPVTQTDIERIQKLNITSGVFLNALQPQVVAPGIKYEVVLPTDETTLDYTVTIKYLDIFQKPRETHICYRPAPVLPGEILPCEDKSQTYSR
jgi:hypothetical protein